MAAYRDVRDRLKARIPARFGWRQRRQNDTVN